ncbi:MAG: undecaprenyl/decaprenyl-phosphate alpha-N-acetylglucosaminyl 1-phosphate transferase [Candidatus Omnitrophica bacterium]|nr:undecaprenyl/decaprenyl-phosphate alpha-N-acetylglucosaminyl 1-phosphate transferase [Candidatus Omnitrophota bacterium]
MLTIQDIIGVFILGAIISYSFTPLVRHIAFKIKLLDHPNINKSHAHPIPLLGGLSIYMAFFLPIIFVYRFDAALVSILIGGTVLLLLGIIDDKLGMMPSMKLTGQLLAALIVYKMGIRVITCEDYYLSMFFTCFWIIGITNAFNLLDNLNGLSSGIGGIASLFFGILAICTGQRYVAMLAFSLAGACFGFLKHNFPKAKIFMGDSGSMFLGFTLSCIAILGSWETDKISISLALPIIVLGYPIFDTALVTFLRIREGRSIFQGGRDHSSHMLASLGFKKTRAVLLIYLICACLGLSAVFVLCLPIKYGAPLAIVAILSMIIFGLYLTAVRSRSAKLKRTKNND